jgi:hypothetical protein
MQQFPPQVNGGLSRLGAGGRVAADWWLAGGVNPADVAAVWQPIGAANLAASYLRIAGNLGHANIDPSLVGGVAPGFDPAPGWLFDGSPRYLQTGITPINNQQWSAIVRFSGASGTFSAFLSYVSSCSFSLRPMWVNLYRAYFNGGNTGARAPGYTSGVAGFAGNQPYINGSAEPFTISPLAGSFNEIKIGGENLSYGFGNIQAIAFYTVTLTAPQVAAVSAAAAALT